MEQAEVETLIEELETRVDRLRALYEQYFIGIERLEPGVPRKDVERRFYVLRRTQIRNTALRFRFQNVLLRYNTYQTYWIRICRQIEEGTYKRDVRRANARFSSSVAPARTEELRANETEEARDTAPPSTLELDIELDVEDFSFSDAETPGGALGLGSPATLPDVPVTKLRPPETVPKPSPPALPRNRIEVPATPTPRQVPVGQDSPGPPRKPPELPLPGRAPRPPPPRPAAPSPGQSSRAVSPVPTQRPPPSSRPRPAPSLDAQVGRKKSRQSMPKVEAQEPLVAPHPFPGSAPRAAPPRPAPKASELSEERVRQIYKQYVETKRLHRESTASLTFDSLAKSLRESSDKLKQKHAGKTVDFEVTVKNGKTVLRPVIK